MVLTVPLYLVAQTHLVRNLYRQNREAFLRMGLGTLAFMLSLRAVSKSVSASLSAHGTPRVH
jgi:hypothetical protein